MSTLYGTDRGMSLRDFFAATVGSSDLVRVNTQSDQEALAGRSRPDEWPDGIDSIRFNLEVKAALRMLYADAMVKLRSI